MSVTFICAGWNQEASANTKFSLFEYNYSSSSTYNFYSNIVYNLSLIKNSYLGIIICGFPLNSFSPIFAYNT